MRLFEITQNNQVLIDIKELTVDFTTDYNLLLNLFNHLNDTR